MLAKANTTARSSCRPAGAHRVDASIEGSDDNDRPWHEAVTGRGQEVWLLKQLYVKRWGLGGGIRSTASGGR